MAVEMARRVPDDTLLEIHSTAALDGLERGHPGNRRLVVSEWSGGAQLIIDHVEARKLKDLLRADPDFMDSKVAKEIRRALERAGLAWDKDTAMSLRYGKKWRAKTAKLRKKDEARLAAARSERERGIGRARSRGRAPASPDAWFDTYPRYARAVLLFGVWVEPQGPGAIDAILGGVGESPTFEEGGVQWVVPDDLDEYAGVADLVRAGRSFVGVVLRQVCGHRRDMERGMTFAELAERIRVAERAWPAVYENLRREAGARPGSLRMGRKPQVVLTASGHLASAELVKGEWTRRRLDDLDVWGAPPRRMCGFPVGLFRGTHTDEQTPYAGGGVHGALVAHAYQWKHRPVRLTRETDRAAAAAVRRAVIGDGRYFLLSSYD